MKKKKKQLSPLCRLVLAKAIEADQPLPEWYLIFPEGISEYANGESILVDESSWQRVQSKLADRGIDVVVDYEHQTQAGTEAPAGGWVKEWKWDGGIWAKIEWTEKAESYLRAKEYRYFSPGFLRKKGVNGVPGKLVAIQHIALTNWAYPQGAYSQDAVPIWRCSAA